MKWLLVGGASLLGLVGLYFLFGRRSDDTKNLGDSFNFDLSVGGIDRNQQGQGLAPQIQVDTKTVLDADEMPARALISQQAQKIKDNSITLSDVRQRYDIGSNLFNGVSNEAPIRTAVANKFNIDGNNEMVYPLLLLPNDAPNLLADYNKVLSILQDVAKIQQYSTLAGQPALKSLFTINSLDNWDVSTVYRNPNESINLGKPSAAQRSDLTKLINNAISEIERFEEHIKYEARQQLRLMGYKFYQDGDNIE